MARLIQKPSYIQAGKAAGYLKYIATRERVEKLAGSGPASHKQRQLIAELLRDCPDAKDLFEYEDYLASPTAATASCQRGLSGFQTLCDRIILSALFTEITAVQFAPCPVILHHSVNIDRSLGKQCQFAP